MNEGAVTPAADNKAPIGLKAYLDGIEAVVRKLPSAWVKCELHTLKVTDRYASMEFIELDAFGKQIAKARGVCWAGEWRRISRAFADAGLPLEAGSQVLVKLEAHVSATFGFQVTVLDVDLTFALGDLSARLQAIRRHLQEAGIAENNRQLPRPVDFLRVAVISPAGAAGLGDFRATVDRLARAGLAEFVYHESPFQTRDAPARIVEILRHLYRECSSEQSRYCAIAIIRGGGASADLAWLVDQKLAEAVCRMNVPVMVGIGHERDRNLLDEIACMAFDTPSKLAEHISSTTVRAATGGQQAFQSIQKQVAQALDQWTLELTNTRHAFGRDANERVRLAEAAVRSAATGLEPGARKLLDETAADVAATLEDAWRTARQRREAAGIAVQALRSQIASHAQAWLRSAELGSGRAGSEIATRIEAIPQAAQAEVERLHEQIGGDALRAADQFRAGVSSLLEQLLADAKQTIEECAATVAMARDRADALHPRTVLAAGYAILRDGNGAPLTSVASLRAKTRVQAEMRDGTADLHSN